jgi:glycosyltransferase involved in cell wall biosynthesis
VCGIIGEVCFNAVLTDRDQFISLRKLGAARGPDDQGYETDNRHYQFGFNRLAILDLSQQGHQPMYSPSRRYVVVFNGEIYNHQLLRDKIADAHLWKGSSDVDIIHSFHYAADYSEAITAKMAGIKWVYTKKNMNWGRGSSNAWKLRTLLADAVLAQNTDMMNEFFPGSTKVSLVPRGVDTDEFKPSEKAQYLLDEFDLPASARIVLCVANLVPVKGVEYLIEAFASLPPSENDYLFIVGDNQNDYAQRLLDQANSYKMQQRIVFTGKRLDVKAFHSIAHTFVLPTLNEGRQEGSPVSLLEAMAAGTHVLASDVAGIRDQLARCPDQLFIPGDAKEIARKIAESLQMDASMYASSIQQQLDIVQSTYTIQKEVLRHEEVYSKLKF